MATRTRNAVKWRRWAVGALLALACSTELLASPFIRFNGIFRIPSRTVRQKTCWFPPCFGACFWDWTETEVTVEVDAAGDGSVLDFVDYDLEAIPGGIVKSGSLPVVGASASGVLNVLDPGEIFIDPCATVRIFVYHVTAHQTWANGLASQDSRSHIITLRCEDCDGDVLELATGGPYRLPWRFGPYETTATWNLSSESEAVEPVVVVVETNVPWLIPEAPRMDVVINPGEAVEIDVPLTILPEAPIGASGWVGLTAVSLRDPTIMARSRTLVLIREPYAPVGETDYLTQCGDPLAGNCFEAHFANACSDPLCCQVVCDADPFCCTVYWDDACATNAAEFCAVK